MWLRVILASSDVGSGRWLSLGAQWMNHLFHIDGVRGGVIGDLGSPSELPKWLSVLSVHNPRFCSHVTRTPAPAGSAYGFEPVGADGVGRAEAGADALLFVLATPESVFSMDTSVGATFDQNRTESAKGPSVGLTFQSSLRSFRCRREEQLSEAGATSLLHPVLLGPPGEQPHALFGASLVHASMLDGPY